MADTKITSLQTPQVTTNPATDVLPIVNIADTSMATSGSTRKITVNQLLGAGGTATLASATITGDLTVDTNVLKVDTTLNRVGIGTASPSGAELDVAGAMRSNSWLGRSNVSAPSGDCSIFRSADNTLGFGIASATAMTLNSTGLGVGVVSANGIKLSSFVTTDGAPATSGTTQTSGSLRIGAASTAGAMDMGTAGSYSWIQVLDRGNLATNYDLVLQKNGGNVGIGVTPSARFHSKAGAVTQGGIIETTGANALLSFADAGTSSYTRVQIGSSGNNLAAFINSVQAMTLDVSGNLLVKKTAVGDTSVGFQATASGVVTSTRSESTDGTGTSYVLYSTGASAYRFYIGMGGTVFATNTTISAISDQRLKENVQDIDVGLGAILALKPRKFDWKAGKGKDIKGDRGFIAQEFEQVFPQLVDEWKDAAPEGETPYKSVRQDLIPVLVKAIQELAAEVNALKNA